MLENLSAIYQHNSEKGFVTGLYSLNENIPKENKFLSSPSYCTDNTCDQPGRNISWIYTKHESTS
jgi:hypothetical protein